mgnify:CR=1 FL=1
METATALRTVTPNKAKKSINVALKKKRPIFLWGPPGIGKSDIVGQITNDLGNSHLIDIRLSLWEPTDIKGIPYFNSKENNMVWAQPSELPTSALAKKHKNIVLFLIPLTIGHKNPCYMTYSNHLIRNNH